MRALLAIAGLGIKQMIKSPLITGLLVLAPILLIFIIGESFRNLIPVDNPYEYITVIVLTQAIAHSALIGYWAIQKEARHQTLSRVSVAPIPAYVFVMGSYVASFVCVSGFMITVALGVALFLGVDMGPSPSVLLAVVICGSAFSAAFGALFGALFPDGRAGGSILSFAVPFLIMVGGGYFPIPEDGPLPVVSPYTPIRWINDAIRTVVSGDIATGEWRTALLCLPVALVLVALAVVGMRRRWQ
jgi:ABC-type multidrug transport system permease subunit